jgi:hypothetical protein
MPNTEILDCGSAVQNGGAGRDVRRGNDGTGGRWRHKYGDSSLRSE